MLNRAPWTAEEWRAWAVALCTEHGWSFIQDGKRSPAAEARDDQLTGMIEATIDELAWKSQECCATGFVTRSEHAPMCPRHGGDR